ncbi:MAG TPA: hypothetical protein VKY89_14280 [Thermoanaerobaculia bacterium]|nr:hypothetical protein [Thermoanaerobaculia bacterium]
MTRAPSPPRTSYVTEVLRLYCRLPDTPDRPRPLDRRLAAELERRRIPLDLVRTAFVLGTARRTFSPSAPLPAIRSLHYFLPILDEVQHEPIDPSYVEHLRRRLQAAGSATPRQLRLRTAIFTE